MSESGEFRLNGDPYRALDRCSHGATPGSCIDCRFAEERKHTASRFALTRLFAWVAFLCWAVLLSDMGMTRAQAWYAGWKARRAADVAAPHSRHWMSHDMGFVDLSGGDVTGTIQINPIITAMDPGYLEIRAQRLFIHGDAGPKPGDCLVAGDGGEMVFAPCTSTIQCSF